MQLKGINPMRMSVISLAIALAISVSACSEKHTVEQYINSGQAHIAAGDYASAIIEFKNAVKLDSKSAVARLALAKAYMAKGNFIFAEKELLRAQKLGAEKIVTLPLLAKSSLKLEKFDDVISLLNSSDSLPDEEYIKVLTFAGISALLNSSEEKAIDLFSQAQSIDSGNKYGQLSLAYSLYANRELPRALTVINQVVAKNNDFYEAMILQGHIFYAIEQYEDASKTFSLYINNYPYDHKVKFYKAQSLLKAKNYQAADEYVTELLEIFPESPTALLYKAQIEFQQKNFTEARTYADKVFVHQSDDVFARVIAGVSSYQLNDTEQTYAHLNIVEHKFAIDHPITKLLSVTRFKLGYETKQSIQISEIEGLGLEDIALLDDLAKHSEMSAIKYQEAKRLANEGLTILASGDIGGIDLIEDASLLAPKLSDVDLRLAIEYIKLAEYDKATEIAERFQASEEYSIVADKVFAHIHLAKQEFNKATHRFQQVLATQSDDVGSLYNLVQIFIRTEQHERAFVHLLSLLEVSPNHKGGLATLIDLSTVTGYSEKTIQYFNNLTSDITVEQVIALAQIYKRSGQLEKAQEILTSKSDNVITNSAYWLILGDNYLEQRKISLANKAYESGLVIDKSHYILNMRYISSFEMLNDIPRAFQESERFIQIYPENIKAMVLYAYFASQNNEFELAKRALTVLKEKKIQHILLDAASGDVALREKDYLTAIESYSSLYERDPNGKNAVRLARALKFNEQPNEAEALLEQYLMLQPDDIKIRLLLIELFNAEQRSEKVKHYNILSKALPNDPLILNNLAWNQYKLGQTTQALENIEKAYSKKPDNVAILSSYGVILAENEKYEQAIKYLQRAIAAGSVDTEVKSQLNKALEKLEGQH